MMEYDWPGNVRELENFVARNVLLTQGGIINVSDLPAFFKKPFLAVSKESVAGELASQGTIKSMREIEKEHILSALKSCNWKKSLSKLHPGRKWRHLSADVLFYYSQAFHFGMQGAVGNAQDLGGATRPGSTTATIFYHSQNMVPLELIDSFQRYVSRASG